MHNDALLCKPYSGVLRVRDYWVQVRLELGPDAEPPLPLLKPFSNALRVRGYWVQVRLELEPDAEPPPPPPGIDGALEAPEPLRASPPPANGALEAVPAGNGALVSDRGPGRLCEGSSSPVPLSDAGSFSSDADQLERPLASASLGGAERALAEPAPRSTAAPGARSPAADPGPSGSGQLAGSPRRSAMAGSSSCGSGQLHVAAVPGGAPRGSPQPPSQRLCQGGADGNLPSAGDCSPDGRQLRTTLRARLQARSADSPVMLCRGGGIEGADSNAASRALAMFVPLRSACAYWLDSLVTVHSQVEHPLTRNMASGTCLSSGLGMCARRTWAAPSRAYRLA